MSNNTNQFASSLGEVFMRIAGKIGSQRHLVAVRDSFIAMMPITLAGAIAVLLNVFLRDIPNSLGWTGFAEAATPLISINGHVYFGTIAIMALFFAFSLGYNMALSYKINPLPAGMVTFAAFVATIPQTLTITTNVAGLETSALAILKEAGMSVLEGADGVSLASKHMGSSRSRLRGSFRFIQCFNHRYDCFAHLLLLSEQKNCDYFAGYCTACS